MTYALRREGYTVLAAIDGQQVEQIRVVFRDENLHECVSSLCRGVARPAARSIDKCDTTRTRCRHQRSGHAPYPSHDGQASGPAESPDGRTRLSATGPIVNVEHRLRVDIIDLRSTAT